MIGFGRCIELFSRARKANREIGERDIGPDICIRKCSRRIWIEAIAPEKGEDFSNLDRVPDLAAGLIAVDEERRRVELRITSAILKKRDRFQEYREQGIVGDNDSCIIAVGACHFPLQAVQFGLPVIVSAVYPFGAERNAFLPGAKTVMTHYRYSAEIPRERGRPIPRVAFQHEHFSGIAGVIWSRRSIGDFLGRPDDFVFVHNAAALKPIPRGWVPWAEEYYPIDEGRRLTRRHYYSRSPLP